MASGSGRHAAVVASLTAANAWAPAGRNIGRFDREDSTFRFLPDFFFAGREIAFFVAFRDGVLFVVLLAFRERFFFLGMNCPLNRRTESPVIPLRCRLKFFGVSGGFGLCKTRVRLDSDRMFG